MTRHIMIERESTEKYDNDFEVFFGPPQFKNHNVENMELHPTLFQSSTTNFSRLQTKLKPKD